MKKSKHYRKDVILARIIAALLLILVIALISFAVSLFAKPSGQDKDSQKPQNTQGVKPGSEDPDDQETEGGNTEPDVDIDTENENKKELYVRTTTQVRLRAEANTNCATLDRINAGNVLLVEEVLEGWYKVTYNGQTGYVSADYTEVVEEQQ